MMPILPEDAPPGDATIGYRVSLLERVVVGHSTRLDSLEDWRAELRGAWRLVTFTLGASILSSIAATVAILKALGAW